MSCSKSMTNPPFAAPPADLSAVTLTYTVPGMHWRVSPTRGAGAANRKGLRWTVASFFHTIRRTLCSRRRRASLGSVRASLDLGMSETAVRLEADRVLLSDTLAIEWSTVETVARGEPMCFLVDSAGAVKIHRFSTTFNRPYSLMATSVAPTLVNSGFTMHRIVGIDPGRTPGKVARLGNAAGTSIGHDNRPAPAAAAAAPPRRWSRLNLIRWYWRSPS